MSQFKVPLGAVPDEGIIERAAIERAKSIVIEEMEGLRQLADSLGSDIVMAASLIEKQTGRLVVTGVGKSGHIGAKLAATFASTGTPSFFLHAAEAIHGDLGMLVRGDVVIAISKSGATRELYPLIDYCADNQIPIIAVTGVADSRLGKSAAVVLKLPDVPEVCPNNLAPTTSSTLTLVIGHVLTVLLMESRKFADADFAQFHPGGRLGLQLSTVARYVDEFRDELPVVSPDALIEEVIATLAEGRKGCVIVCDCAQLRGIITEGDLRRAYSPSLFSKTAADIMTHQPTTITPEEMMGSAIQMMKNKRISNLIVVEGNKPIHVLHVKDVLERGYV